MIELIQKVEDAIKAHPALRLATSEDYAVEFKFTRLGWWCEAKVLTGRQRRASRISGDGETPEMAAQKLIDSLDCWAAAI